METPHINEFYHHDVSYGKKNVKVNKKANVVRLNLNGEGANIYY